MITSSEEDLLPIVKQYNYNVDIKEQISTQDNDNKYITRYPTVYIVIDKLSGKNNASKFKAYVGETNNIVRRTKQHLNDESDDREDWMAMNNSKKAKLIVIAHKKFNKSLTLDIENKLMQYLVSDNAIGKLNNRRSNDQDLYYTHDEFKSIFEGIWKELSKKRKDIFPNIDDLKKSAIFKQSPFTKLTDEQENARNQIIDKVDRIENTNSKDKLIVINGSAGTGKTVLLSSLFAELNTRSDNQEAYMLVNRQNQLDVYSNIATKLGIKSKLGDDIANKPTKFINKHMIRDEKTKVAKVTNPADVVLIDEAHLLLTSGTIGYSGHGQLKEILKTAKVVVAVFDAYQFVRKRELIRLNEFSKMLKKAEIHGNLVKLTHQNRMIASKLTMDWIDNIIDDGIINKIPYDKEYDLRIFDDVNKMYDAIKKHNNSRENKSDGLSRVVATYDWPFKNKKKKIKNSDGTTTTDMWRVQIGDNFNLPWNYQLPVDKQFKKTPWAEQPQTIDEVGSVFTIQGFDLNYCGLIIGPSVKYRDGRIVYDGKENCDRDAKGHRSFTDEDGNKIDDKTDLSNQLIRNALNILMKRGVHGLYIYAVDDELRNELLKNM